MKYKVKTNQLEHRLQNATSLADRLKVWRKSKGISGNEMPRLSGVSHSYYWSLEWGNQDNPGLDTLRKLARALDITITELVGE